jgi:ligand-binding SRPBCC domain-containing protein
MPIHEHHASVRLASPLAEVFAYFSDAYNLEELTPPWLRFEVGTPRPIEMAVGTEIEYRLKIRGIPVRWQSEITAWEPPFRFVDEQRKGPYSLWIHEHRFREEDGQTVAEDHIRYAVPGGSLVHRLFVRRDVERIFAFRKRKMEELFGAAPALSSRAA